LASYYRNLLRKKKLPSVCLLSNKWLGERENFQNYTTLKALAMSSTK